MPEKRVKLMPTLTGPTGQAMPFAAVERAIASTGSQSVHRRDHAVLLLNLALQALVTPVQHLDVVINEAVFIDISGRKLDDQVGKRCLMCS